MKELVLTLTRAAILAQHEGRRDDAHRINRAICALITMHETENDEGTSPGVVGPEGTRIGLGVAA